MFSEIKKYALFVALIVTLCVPSVYGSGAKTMEQMLSDYVDWFHRNMDPEYAEKAKLLIPILVKYSSKYEVDPFLIAQTFSSESSWRNFKGELGERGPGNVMPATWVEQFDLNTLDGQIEASVFLWRMALDKCVVSDPHRHLERAFTHYASGGCFSRSEITKKNSKGRIRKYKKAVERFKVTND